MPEQQVVGVRDQRRALPARRHVARPEVRNHRNARGHSLENLDARASADAQRHLLEALNTRKPVGEKGIGPLPLFYRIVTQFRTLQEPQQDCRAWITKFRQGRCPAALANISLVVCARNREEAEKHVSMIVRAMDPEAAALPPEKELGYQPPPVLGENI
jgi:hypothetical protein